MFFDLGQTDDNYVGIDNTASTCYLYVVIDYMRCHYMTYHHGNLRKSLLDRAAHVIAESGVEALSLRALARDIGVSHAAPARHFKDKKALLSALATEGNKRLTTAITAAANAVGSDPVARYNAMGKAVIRFAIENPAYQQATHHPDVIQSEDESLALERRAYMTEVTKAASAAQAAGWRQSADITALTLFSSAAAIGTAFFVSNTGKSGFLDGQNITTLIDQVIDLVIPPNTAALHAQQET